MFLYVKLRKNTKKRFYNFDISLAVCVGKIVPYQYLLRSAGGMLIYLTLALSPQVDKPLKSLAHGQNNVKPTFTFTAIERHPCDQYQIILLGHRGTCVRTTFLRLLP